MWNPECCFINFLRQFSENYSNFYIFEYLLKDACLKDAGGVGLQRKNSELIFTVCVFMRLQVIPTYVDALCDVIQTFIHTIAYK